MQTLADLLNTIPAIDPAAMSRAQRHIDGLLKPVGSLGRLEALGVQLAGMPGLNGIPHVGKKAVLVMCADHGVWEEGVAISPKEVTAIQAENMTRGTTGVCVLAAQAGANVHVIDVGIDTAEPIPGLINMRVARGSGNIASAPAMSRRQAEKLLLDVICYTRELAKNGVTLFGVGELGMANTTPAAAIVSTITGRDPEEVVGIGANLPTDKLANKIDVVRRAITLNQPNPQDGVNVLAKVGGFDLVGMAGVMLGAASCGLPVLLDGFLSYAADSISLVFSEKRNGCTRLSMAGLPLLLLPSFADFPISLTALAFRKFLFCRLIQHHSVHQAFPADPPLSLSYESGGN